MVFPKSKSYFEMIEILNENSIILTFVSETLYLNCKTIDQIKKKNIEIKILLKNECTVGHR